MPTKVTKAAGNRYCQARLKAAQYNDKLSSRAGASEELSGISEDSLKKYELGLTNPPTEAVVIMADAYNAPELLNWYCANECPIGKDRVFEVTEMPPERACLRTDRASELLQEVNNRLKQILDDGLVDDAERLELPQLVKGILECRRVIDELEAAVEKLIKE